MIGKSILGYHVDEEIGSGGFGTVYKVSKTNVSGTYTRALKHITLPTRKQYSSVLNSMGGDASKADDYFAGILNDIVNEIRILSTLSEGGTQNIVRYYENDITETLSPKTYDIYILMEYLTPFPDYIETHSYTVRDVIHIGKDILTALIACHGKHIIHRDIKDDNIFVSSDGVFKLGDFGVSKALKDKSRAESMRGTPNFIAPEVYLGREKYDNTVDLYSLGIVLYKLLNKARNPFLPEYPAPYTSHDEEAAFDARMTGKIPPLPLCAENKLGEAVLKAIMPRNERYNSAKEFWTALNDVEEQLDESELRRDLSLSTPVETNIKPKFPIVKNTLNHDETIVGDIIQESDNGVNGGSERHLFDTISSQRGTIPVSQCESSASQSKPPVPTFTLPETLRSSPEEASTPSSERATSPSKMEVTSNKDSRLLIAVLGALITAISLIFYFVIVDALS